MWGAEQRVVRCHSSPHAPFRVTVWVPDKPAPAYPLRAVVDGNPKDHVECSRLPGQSSIEVTPIVSSPGTCDYGAQPPIYVAGERAPQQTTLRSCCPAA